jgi:glutamyl-tRNA reductase
MMYLDNLILVQCRSDQSELKTQLREALVDHGYCLDTCLRSVWITDDAEVVAQFQAETGTTELRLFQGELAYDYLLRIACGLESVVKGETEVFAQLKSSWQAYLETGAAFAERMRPWMQKLILDTKEIRRTHLQGIGGASYGSLARMICNPQPGDRVLILGMGQLGQAVAPLFSRQQLLVWNRSKAKLQRSLIRLSEKCDVQSIADVDLLRVINTVEHVIICTPAGLEVEEEWIYSRLNGGQIGKVVHLGGKAHLTKAWEKVQNFHSLSEVFSLQADQNQIKQERIKRALSACAEKAHHRFMMDAIALNHGWEDLTAF